MDTSFVCVGTSWRRGRARCKIRNVISFSDIIPPNVCLHEVPTCSLPLTATLQERVRSDHLSFLATCPVRCCGDATAGLQRRRKARDLPVHVYTTPPYLLGNPVGQSSTTSLADILEMLRQKQQGEWILLASATATQALPASTCRLPDVGPALPLPPPTEPIWKIYAKLLGGTAQKRKRIENLAKLADATSGAYEAERMVAQRLLARERLRPPATSL